MAMRLGLGPVFVYEWLFGSRRWHGYALRSLFVAALLASLIVVWLGELRGRGDVSFRELAAIGRIFYIAIVGTQLVLIMLAAPAAMAGAICLDKSRGTLAHLLVTDLSNSEIVLGKMVARLIPALGLLVCGVPVMALGTLLGGINPNDLLGAFFVTVGTAVLGCAMALTFSVWASKVHEVLLACLAVGTVWLLAFPAWRVLSLTGPIMGPPAWIQKTNPFWLAIGATFQPGAVTLEDSAWFSAGCLLLSLAFTGFAIASLRHAAIREGSRQTGTRRRTPSLRSLVFGKLWVPGPSLDRNPVLWREWHRQRPSRWSRVIWALYGLSAAVGTLYTLGMLVFARAGGVSESLMAALWSGFVVSAGFLLVSVSSCTSLAEERVRGSLEVLLATPLSTRDIVVGKWWGAFRVVPLLAIPPTMVALAIAWTESSTVMPSALFVTLYILALGASLTSVGLALATWIQRLGRVLALSVTYYVLLAVGWVFLMMVLLSNDNFYGPGLAMASPFFAMAFTTLAGTDRSGPFHGVQAILWALFWTITHLAIAGLLLSATLRSFDRCMGRITGRAVPHEGRFRETFKPSGIHELKEILDL